MFHNFVWPKSAAPKPSSNLYRRRFSGHLAVDVGIVSDLEAQETPWKLFRAVDTISKRHV